MEALKKKHEAFENVLASQDSKVCQFLFSSIYIIVFTLYSILQTEIWNKEIIVTGCIISCKMHG